MRERRSGASAVGGTGQLVQLRIGLVLAALLIAALTAR